MPLMSFDEWRAKAMANAGPNWRESDARDQYDMYKYRQENNQALGGGNATYNAINQGQQAGFSTADAEDPTGMRAWAREHGMSEGYGRFDNATLQVWEKYRDSNCPPNLPYRAMDGSGCVEKPIDSNSGARHEQGWAGAGQGGGAGAPGTGQNAAYSGGYTPLDPLQQKLMALAGGGGGFFGQNPRNNVAALKGGGVWWGQGADFSQAFNPLAPKGNAPQGGGGAMPAANNNPFQSTAQQLQGALQGGMGGNTQGTPFMNAAVLPNMPQYKRDMLEGLNQRNNPLNSKLNQFYGGR